jgi:hypothetical protein
MRYRVTSRWQRLVGTGVFSLFFFLEIGAYFDRNGTQPGEITFTTIFLLVIATAAVRSYRSATLLADDRKIIVRSLMRTRSWAWQEVDSFLAETRLVGAWVKYRRRVLGLRERDGTVRWFPGLNCRPAKGARKSWVDDTVAVLNRYQASGLSPGMPAK